MDVQLAENQVKIWAEANSSALGLNNSKIEVKYIWNPGGFVNQSYRVSDGETIRHVKFAPEQSVPKLQQWAKISHYLTNSYNAPQLIHEITQQIIPGYPYGLVSKFIKGKPLSGYSTPMPVIEQALKILHELHNDQEIKKLKANDATAPSYAEAFIEEYITRFEEDLRIIKSEKHLLDFVGEDTIDWFDAEINALKQLAIEHPSFQQAATDVVHNDINWENILADDHHNFWIIDWDDLTVCGDAAMDYSVLLWPLYNTKDWPQLKNQIIDQAGNEILDRMELYFRAKLLDDVIDVLADYIEAENMPDVKEMAQKRAEEIHLRAYPEYRRLYFSDKK